MRLTDILKPACVKVPLIATDKEAALYELVDLLAEHHDIPDPQLLKDAIWQREQSQTTGIGLGIGIPHGKTGCITSFGMAVGVPQTPLDYQSFDSKPVELIFLLASPEDQTTQHIEALAQVTRMLSDDAFRESLKRAGDAAQAYDMIAQRQATIAGA